MDANCRFYGHDYGQDWLDRPTRCRRCGAAHPSSRDWGAKDAVKRAADEAYERIFGRAASTGDEP